MIEEMEKVHLSGTVSQVFTSCFVENGDCYNYGGYPVENFGISSTELHPVEVSKYGTLDEYLNKPYKKIAEVEIFADKDGKYFRYAKVIDGSKPAEDIRRSQRSSKRR